MWAVKIGAIEPEETLPMRRGRRFEATIAEEYSEQTGRPVLAVPEYELFHHPSISWLAASLDRKVLATEQAPDPFGRWDVVPTTHGRAPLEIKMSLGSASHWKDEPPLAYAIQVTIEMACADSTWGALCGMVGPGPLKTFDLPRNDAFLEAALPRLEEFWLRVQRRQPPEADALPGTTEALKRLYAGEDWMTIALGPEAMRLVEQWEQATARRDAADETSEELENKLRLRMGLASWGALPDGSFLTLRTIERKSYSVGPTSFRTLRRWWPRIKRERT